MENLILTLIALHHTDSSSICVMEQIDFHIHRRLRLLPVKLQVLCIGGIPAYALHIAVKIVSCIFIMVIVRLIELAVDNKRCNQGNNDNRYQDNLFLLPRHIFIPLLFPDDLCIFCISDITKHTIFLLSISILSSFKKYFLSIIAIYTSLLAKNCFVWIHFFIFSHS